MKYVMIFLLSASLYLQAIDYDTIGQRYWQNESGGKKELLVFWNAKEEFPSLGIGDFIWYPSSYQGPFTEVFPQFLEYCKKHNISLPRWLKHCTKAPWKDRDAFLADQKSERMKQLRSFLENTMAEQAQFIIEQFKQSLPEIFNALPQSKRALIKQRVTTLLHDTQGAYILIDYSNFKGTGLSETERYAGFGWGELQVLEEMTPQSEYLTDLKEAFVETALKVLKKAHCSCACSSP